MTRSPIAAVAALLLSATVVEAQSYRGATSSAALQARAEIEELASKGVNQIPPASDAILISGRFEEMLVGREAITEAMRAVSERSPRPNPKVEYEVVAIEVADSGDLGYVAYNSTTTWDKGDGTRTGIKASGVFVLRKTAEGWRGAAWAIRDWPAKAINP